ncbi:hypothetical protein BC831DRAFT_482015 [Entophlyctis helioformis]|nr:hypothetical protein BC831DRAFT_482015 [Entophlyctis helioformis]
MQMADTQNQKTVDRGLRMLSSILFSNTTVVGLAFQSLYMQPESAAVITQRHSDCILRLLGIKEHAELGVGLFVASLDGFEADVGHDLGVGKGGDLLANTVHDITERRGWQLSGHCVLCKGGSANEADVGCKEAENEAVAEGPVAARHKVQADSGAGQGNGDELVLGSGEDGLVLLCEDVWPVVDLNHG